MPYYHISGDRSRESILRHGLKITVPVHTTREHWKRGIYVFTDLLELGEILFWLYGNAAKSAEKRWAVFQVDVTGLLVVKDDTFASSYVVLSDIPPSRIKYLGNAYDVSMKDGYKRDARILRRRKKLTYWSPKGRETTITSLSGLRKHWGVSTKRKKRK